MIKRQTWGCSPLTKKYDEYPLVNYNVAIENCHLETVDLPIKNGDFNHGKLCKLSVYRRVNDLPLENCHSSYCQIRIGFHMFSEVFTEVLYTKTPGLVGK